MDFEIKSGEDFKKVAGRAIYDLYSNERLMFKLKDFKRGKRTTGPYHRIAEEELDLLLLQHMGLIDRDGNVITDYGRQVFEKLGEQGFYSNKKSPKSSQ